MTVRQLYALWVVALLGMLACRSRANQNRASTAVSDLPPALEVSFPLLALLILRFPAGINLRWLRGALDSYTEIVPIITLGPRREVLYTMATGIRWRF